MVANIRGIGTKFNGISEIDNEGNITATYWIVFLFLPIFPLFKCKLRREITSAIFFKYQIIEKQPLQWKEVLLTYLFGWIIIPILWLGPLFLCIREIAVYIGIPDASHGSGFGIYHLLVLYAIIHLVVFVWRLKEWDEKRGLP